MGVRVPHQGHRLARLELEINAAEDRYVRPRRVVEVYVAKGHVALDLVKLA
jgi:hypothetical protein